MEESWLDQFPLRALGRNLVNKHGERFKLAGVNWYGASDTYHVVGGLDMRSLGDLCNSVAAMGFTVVRLPFSSEMLRIEEVCSRSGAIDYNLNPELLGLSPLEVFDQVVESLGAAGVSVVLNNHTTLGAWSGGVELNGLWFRENCEIYTEMAWIADWLEMAGRYKSHPHVIGYDLRNEVRPTSVMGAAPGWGTGDERDWARAAGNCARALVGAREGDGIIIVERICWPQSSLESMLQPTPPWEAWGIPRDRMVLSLHMYAWSGPGSWSPKAFTGTVMRALFHVYDYVGSRALYGEMGDKELEEQMDREFGFCLDQDICPVWLSELGADLNNEYELSWFNRVCLYLEQKDADFAYWPLNVGRKPGGDEDEGYGILTNDWQPRWSDPRLKVLRRLSSGTTLHARSRGDSDFDVTNSQPARRRTPSSQQHSPLRGPPLLARAVTADEAAALQLSEEPVQLLDVVHGDGHEPLSLAPFPWCTPLPGPLVEWPGSLPLLPRELPEGRFRWSALHGFDADPGEDAEVLQHGDLDKLKLACVDGGFGGFALHEDWAYMRKASPEVLRSKLQSGYPHTIMFLAEEVRLCAVWTRLEELRAEVQEKGLNESQREQREDAYLAPPEARPCLERQDSQAQAVLLLPEEEPEEAVLETCQRACLHGKCGGYELLEGTPRKARLLSRAEAHKVEQRWRRGDFRLASSASRDPNKNEVHLLELAPVSIGLDVFRGMDAFQGSSARVLRDANLTQCRQLCLEEGYGGFSFRDGEAHFRTAAGDVLWDRLVPSPESTFYVLTASEVCEKSLKPSLRPQALTSAQQDLPLRGEKLQKILPQLWSPKAARRKRGYSVFSGCGSPSHDTSEHFDDTSVMMLMSP
ncbi:unnamed protein product [Polarella glacialis]|uniref:Glycoside hydrolase family 5 domain-containing protein n=1 Tax=Polarella glacialis TaxID=89957 RepID=A0A813LAB6_POLGL|nr:unnamed protein product [Polarella glacialis]